MFGLAEILNPLASCQARGYKETAVERARSTEKRLTRRISNASRTEVIFYGSASHTFLSLQDSVYRQRKKTSVKSSKRYEEGFTTQKYRELHGFKNLEYKKKNGNPERDVDKIK